MIKVSVIVPVYNTEKYLTKCIDSIITQTEEDIEIIIINDGSTDNCDKIIKTYEDKRIKYIKKENTGIGSTRNIGINKSKGEYLMFIDSDDYIDSNCIKKMYNYATKTKSDLIISDYYKDYGDKIERVLIKDFKQSSLENNPKILNYINLGPCNKLFKRDILKGIRFEENLKYEDAPFVIKALKNAKRIAKYNDCLSYYVIHNNSQTTIRDIKIFDIFKISNIIQSTLKEDVYYNALVDLIVMLITDYTIQQRYVKDFDLRNNFIEKAFKELNKMDLNWRNCNYLKKFSFIKRYIKTNKFLTKLYCTIYAIFINK